MGMPEDARRCQRFQAMADTCWERRVSPAAPNLWNRTEGDSAVIPQIPLACPVCLNGNPGLPGVH